MLVYNEKEYAQAIDYLHTHPHQRRQMGRGARRFALQHFGGERSASKLHQVYQTLPCRPKRQHIWQSSTSQSLAAAHLRGTEHFVESLGSDQTPYHVSIYGQGAETVLRADEQIARQTSLERQLLRTYRSFYPQDVYLPYWLGLASQHAGKYEQTIAEFSQARLDGPTAWRLPWRRSQIAATLDKREQALEFCRLVLEQRPDLNPGPAPGRPIVLSSLMQA